MERLCLVPGGKSHRQRCRCRMPCSGKRHIVCRDIRQRGLVMEWLHLVPGGKQSPRSICIHQLMYSPQLTARCTPGHPAAGCGVCRCRRLCQQRCNRSRRTHYYHHLQQGDGKPACRPAGFTVTVDGTTDNVTAVVLGTNNNEYDLTLTTTVQYDQVVTLSYNVMAGLQSTDGEVLAAFSDMAVTNNVPAVQPSNGYRGGGSPAQARFSTTPGRPQSLLRQAGQSGWAAMSR